MKRRVLWSRDALDEFKEIIAYIARDNSRAARKVATIIRTTGDRLGSLATGRRGRVSGTYERSVRGLPYIVAYGLERLPEGGEAVVILRVIHASRNWPDEDWPESGGRS
ncbi:MAG: type II toxin-antitoxin system RelE/ParE family toxin [Hyphomicrobiales bacterium]